MKTRLFAIILMLAGIVSCQHKDLPAIDDNDAEYIIEISQSNGTKATGSTELDLANLDYTYKTTLNASLKKKDRTTGDYKEVGPNLQKGFEWTAAGTSPFTVSDPTGEETQIISVTASRKGEGKLHISASLNGVEVATKEHPVKVTDRRAMSWENVTSEIDCQKEYTAILKSNFTGDVTVSSDCSSFKVGEASGNLNPTATIQIGGKETTVYYKYDGTSTPSIKMTAKSKDQEVDSQVQATSSPIVSTGKKTGLFYRLGGSWKSMDSRGTYSSKHKINTSAYAGECYYCDFKAGLDYLDNGACTPDIMTDEIASFIYYESGEEKNISVSVSKPTCIVDNMNLWNRTESAYPYKDGKHFIGSHTSYVTITVTLPNSTTQTYWGYITETDNFGDLCHFYPHYGD